jgi:hypothetical protein
MNADIEKLAGPIRRQLAAIKPSDVRPQTDFTVPSATTLVACPPRPLIDGIVEVMDRLRAIEPDHYYYPVEQLHMTVQGFGPDAGRADVDPRQLDGLLPANGIPYAAIGSVTNYFNVSFPLYPLDDSLTATRQKLRQAVGRFDVYNGQGDVWESVMWINFMRFAHQPSDAFMTAVHGFAQREWGEYVITGYELCRTTSKVLAPSQTELLGRFPG